MLRILKNQKGFTLIELVIIIILIGVLAAIAVPKYVDLRENAVVASAQATLDAGRAAVSLDFADKILNTGSYTDLFPNTAGADTEITNASDLSNLEAELQSAPNYPPTGKYNDAAGVGFRWLQITAANPGGTNQPPAIDALIDVTCDVADAKTGANDDCYVSKL